MTTYKDAEFLFNVVVRGANHNRYVFRETSSLRPHPTYEWECMTAWSTNNPLYVSHEQDGDNYLFFVTHRDDTGKVGEYVVSWKPSEGVTLRAFKADTDFYMVWAAGAFVAAWALWKNLMLNSHFTVRVEVCSSDAEWYV